MLLLFLFELGNNVVSVITPRSDAGRMKWLDQMRGNGDVAEFLKRDAQFPRANVADNAFPESWGALHGVEMILGSSPSITANILSREFWKLPSRLLWGVGSTIAASDSDFQTCSCVSGGSGTTTNPYIIGPWTINSLARDGVGVSVDGTLLTKSFTLFNLTLAGNGAASSTGIVLNHINPSGQNTISAAVTGPQTSIQNAGIGIVVANSSFVTLDGGGANPNGAGIGSGSAGTINKKLHGRHRRGEQ